MSNDLKRINRELLEDFIRTYQSLPCLWNSKSKDYHDKSKRAAAYDILLKKFRLIDASADRDTVVRKINTFRSNYRREKRKVEESYHPDSGINEYETTLWYYKLFSFLEGHESPKASSPNLNNREEELGEQPDEKFNEDLTLCSEELSTPSPRNTLSVQRKHNNLKYDSMGEPMEHWKCPKLQDRYEVMGQYVALKMKDIANNNQRLLAEKLVSDVLFMAEMGQLTLSHSVRGDIG